MGDVLGEDGDLDSSKVRVETNQWLQVGCEANR